MTKFVTYLPPQTCHTLKPAEEIDFVGYSYPHYSQVRAELEKRLGEYPNIPPREANFSIYSTVHTDEYLHKLTLMATDQHVTDPPRLSRECTGYPYCLPGYLYSMGGIMEAIERMKSGQLERAFTFSLGGHHAYSDWGHGYCLLNPLAAAARYAQMQGFEKILMVDWDIHHGDGTQSIFANDDSVYSISIHSAADLYVGKMVGLRAGTTTEGEAVGHCNIPILDKVYEDDFFAELELPGQFYRAEQSLDIFQNALSNLPWQPDLILIFAGCDSHRDDSGKDITDWDNQDFQTLTRSVLDVARQANCPVLSSQGGGYNLPVTVSVTVDHVHVLATY